MKSYKFIGPMAGVSRFISDATKVSKRLEEFNRQVYLLLQDEVFKMDSTCSVIEVEGKPEIKNQLYALEDLVLYQRFFDECEIDQYLIEVPQYDEGDFFLLSPKTGSMDIDEFSSFEEAKEAILEKEIPSDWIIAKKVCKVNKINNPTFEIEVL